MLKTIEGKMVLWVAKPAEGQVVGQQVEHWPVDAKLLLKLGSHTAEPPAGVEAVPPPAVPKHIGVPVPPVVQTPVAPEPAVAKKGKEEPAKPQETG